MKMGTYTFHWNTQQGHRFKRFSSFFRWKGIYWRLFLYWQQLYRVIPHETSVRLVPGQSWSWRHFWEMNMLMLTRAAQWRPCQTHSHSTRHCVVCVSHKSHSRGYGWLKMKMLHMYAVAASIAFLLYMVILFSSNNNSLILLFTNGNPWLYHCSSFEICNCNHYSLRKGF